MWARVRIDYTGCAQRRASRDDAVECIVLGTLGDRLDSSTCTVDIVPVDNRTFREGPIF